ncbi:hypothetical protein SASPL_109785 [Salvia splendens]|uniref:KHA domain-containing protein n=1 Tax=Salvia splendens TaxID=180675 RepID=A0A8X9A6M4_SALSN|nr:hypothetical protein SASPL_109785 [Salvia splendens]
MADDCSGILSSYAGFYLFGSSFAHYGRSVALLDGACSDHEFTITCLEKGDAAGKVVVCPRSFKDLKEIGVERYGAPYARVLSIEGVEIHDIRGVKDGHHIDFSRQAPLIEEEVGGQVEDGMILIIESREEEIGGQVEDGMIDESLGEEREEFGGNEERLVGQDMERNGLGLEARARNADLAADVEGYQILISDTCSSVVGIFTSFVDGMRKEMRVVNQPLM